jgi:hypothetical protein
MNEVQNYAKVRMRNLKKCVTVAFLFTFCVIVSCLLVVMPNILANVRPADKPSLLKNEAPKQATVRRKARPDYV